MCLDTLVDLILGPGWNGNYDHFDGRLDDIQQLRHWVETDRLVIYVPPLLIAAVQMTVQAGYGVEHAHHVVQQILRLCNSNLAIDNDRVLDQANVLLLNGEGRLDLYDVVLLPIASALKIDAIVAHQPALLTQVLVADHQEMPTIDFPVVTVSGFIRLATNQCFHSAANPTEIFVLTPEQNVVSLARGATPVDFAYTIHTRLGDRCLKALVNGTEVPLDTLLKTGDVVKIVKGEDVKPDPAWLKFVVTRTAKQGINRGIKRYQSDQGWQMIKQALGKNVRVYRQRLECVAAELNCASTHELAGKLGAKQIKLDAFMTLLDQCRFQQVDDQVVLAPRRDSAHWRLASCCTPLPGDAIVGVKSRGDRPMRIHRQHCPKLKTLQAEQLQDVAWNCDRCQMQLQIVMTDSPDIVRPLLNDLVEHYDVKPDLRGLTIAKDGKLWLSLSMTVTSRPHFEAVMQYLQTNARAIRIKMTKLMPLPRQPQGNSNGKQRPNRCTLDGIARRPTKAVRLRLSDH